MRGGKALPCSAETAGAAIWQKRKEGEKRGDARRRADAEMNRQVLQWQGVAMV